MNNFVFKPEFSGARQLTSWVVGVVFLLILSSCLSFGSGAGGVALYSGDQWAILPSVNNSGVASADGNVESLIESNLRARGVNGVHIIQVKQSIDALEHAAEQGARYAVTSTVEQWGRSKLNGRDSRVSLELSVHDVMTGEIVWQGEQASGKRGSSSVSGVANIAVAKIVNSMNLLTGVDQQSLDASRTDAVNVASSGLSSRNGSNPIASSVGFRRVSMDSDGFTTKVGSDLVGNSLAIYYGANPPAAELSQFDRLVLEPDNIDATEFSELTEHGAVAYAYLSVGEVGPTRAYAAQIKEEWVLGKNDVWNSKVLDLSNVAVVEFLMRRIDALVNAGYAGLFLDTMDSYQIYAKTPEQKIQQEAAIGAFVQQVTQRHAGIKLISNRGFEVLGQTGPFLEAIAAESLFSSWDNTAQRYVDVPESDRQWLLGKLNSAKAQFGLDVIAIEYMPPERREEARQVASSVVDLGFIPWVSTPALDYVGVGSMEVMPRKVMLLFDSRSNGRQANTEVHELVAPLLEYYGYVPEYFDVATQALPSEELKGQIAGIVTWSSSQYPVAGLPEWFKKQMSSDIPVAIFGSPIVPLDNWMAEKLGVSANGAIHAESLESTHKTSMVDYEKPIPVRLGSLGLNARSTSSSNEVHLSVEDKKGVQADLVVTGDWGGYAVHPAASNAGLDDTYYWVTDPFAFLEKTLRLQKLPMPDVTTENGNRLWSSHIDGDALPSWAEVPGKKLGAEMIHETILKRYNMPHSISIVEAEMTSIEAYADRRERMFNVARQIFAMPSVEIATHTFSHPYAWDKVALYPGSGKYNIDVGNYQYSAEREIGGSAKFINENLAPAGKATNLMLWSGNALPEEPALAAAYNNGLINLNGGFTTISKAFPAISRISPMARTVGKYVQAYAPIMNENVYTNDWLGPFDGFRRVIETFEMTDKPRRFKPLSIYYHFYAGTKRASLRSLEEIYDWSLKQDIFPIHASYYARKVPDFRTVGVSRYLDGSWKLSGLGNIKSIRILDKNTWPELALSEGIVGARQLHDGVYMHTNGSGKVLFKTAKQAPQGLHLVAANGQVSQWSQTQNGLEMRIVGEVPVKLELSLAAAGCSIRSNGQLVRGSRTEKNTTVFSFSTRDTGNAILNCQA